LGFVVSWGDVSGFSAPLLRFVDQLSDRYGIAWTNTRRRQGWSS